MREGRRIILFPGMGADARMFEPQRAVDAEIEVPRWVAPRRRETLASYAKRMAGTLDVSRPFVLGGASLGGMVAWEAAQHVPADKLRGIVLLSTCRSYRGVPRAYRWAGRLAAALPAFVHRAAKHGAPMARKRFGVVTAEQARLFTEMLRDADPAFIRWSLGALLRWPGPACVPDVPVLHVHGAADRILPCRREVADVVIEGAGHLMNVTHADAANVAISMWLNELDARCTGKAASRFK